MISMAGALARRGHIPFVHTFGVFATRRPLDQIVNSVAYPNLPVRIVGFMPGVSSPGGPSHQAIEDVALMRAMPNMTVIDVADAVEIRQAVGLIADLPGPGLPSPQARRDPGDLRGGPRALAGAGADPRAGKRRGAHRQRHDAVRRPGGGGRPRRGRRERGRRQRAGHQATGRRHDHRGGVERLGGDHRGEPLGDRRSGVRGRRGPGRGGSRPAPAADRAAGHLRRGCAERRIAVSQIRPGNTGHRRCGVERAAPAGPRRGPGTDRSPAAPIPRYKHVPNVGAPT